ncbi:ABC transporter ATP-binding protein [Pontibacillus litoralis]|uniref:ABC transporter ATP-binding protein n=1 Tax=Pontibacillus litoralis JSM 072002 TaxID=1385512 RepID=A0A0A5G463_9BACI|nr:ABC transporter ATP-binding protein [Pontibacillus litoralis]KGX86844.1 ABC transporter ATP-binding protein [Pontibacillus litoralis JSM 072002]
MGIDLTDVNKVYQSGEVEVHALKNASLHIADKSVVVILGPSGSGKSTLLNVIGGIDRYESGTIKVEGQTLHELKDKMLTEYRRHTLGFIFQQYNLIPTLTVYENVEVGRHLSENPLNMQDTLEKVGMWDKKDKFPFQLSGGEQQRVAIARALVKNPKILMCDEPTGALDEETGKKILTLLKYVNETYGTTVCIITHNHGIGEMAHSVIRMKSGEIVENYQNETPVHPERVTWA